MLQMLSKEMQQHQKKKKREKSLKNSWMKSMSRTIKYNIISLGSP